MTALGPFCPGGLDERDLTIGVNTPAQKMKLSGSH